MRILKVTVEDDNAGLLKKLLQEVSFVKNVEEEPIIVDSFQEPESPYERLRKIQQEIGDKNLLKEIKDPSEWQREIRKEWDRDF
jgi:ribonuclease HIII